MTINYNRRTDKIPCCKSADFLDYCMKKHENMSIYRINRIYSLKSQNRPNNNFLAWQHSNS